MKDTLWQNLSIEEKMASAQAVAHDRKIDERAVEKDWWVTAVFIQRAIPKKFLSCPQEIYY